MDQIRTLLKKQFLGAGGALAAKCLNFLSQGNWDGLQRAVSYVEPQKYRYASTLRRDMLVVGAVKKLLLPGDKQKRKQAALAKFFAAEQQCAATNYRMRYLGKLQDTGFYPDPIYLRVILLVEEWQKELKRVLGGVPVKLQPKFGSGSTTTDRGKLVTTPDKMSTSVRLYPNAESVFRHTWQDTAFERAQIKIWRGGVTFSKSNILFTVPKNCDEDRLAALELNGVIPLQLACGRTIRERFNKGYGVTLQDLQQSHRDAARQGSITGSIATIDLSSASDTVARELVRLILPPDWFSLLDSLRAPCTNVDGKDIYNQKMSTMGCGFTFELETLIFRSLLEVLGCERSFTSVYGDDIICPSENAADVLSALKFFGFTPNQKKSFCEGPFRESCGGDYFEGVAVRPHFLKEIPTEPQHWVELANGLRRADPDLQWSRAAWRYCIDQIPRNFRCYGPARFGDLCINLPESELADHCAPTMGGNPWYWCQIPIPRTIPVDRGYFDPTVVLAHALFGGRPRVQPRNSVSGYKRRKLPDYGLSGDVTYPRTDEIHLSLVRRRIL